MGALDLWRTIGAITFFQQNRPHPPPPLRIPSCRAVLSLFINPIKTTHIYLFFKTVTVTPIIMQQHLSSNITELWGLDPRVFIMSPLCTQCADITASMK